VDENSSLQEEKAKSFNPQRSISTNALSLSLKKTKRRWKSVKESR
jgi:hypothetical protein